MARRPDDLERTVKEITDSLDALGGMINYVPRTSRELAECMIAAVLMEAASRNAAIPGEINRLSHCLTGDFFRDFINVCWDDLDIHPTAGQEECVHQLLHACSRIIASGLKGEINYDKVADMGGWAKVLAEEPGSEASLVMEGFGKVIKGAMGHFNRAIEEIKGGDQTGTMPSTSAIPQSQPVPATGGLPPPAPTPHSEAGIP